MPLLSLRRLRHQDDNDATRKDNGADTHGAQSAENIGNSTDLDRNVKQNNKKTQSTDLDRNVSIFCIDRNSRHYQKIGSSFNILQKIHRFLFTKFP